MFTKVLSTPYLSHKNARENVSNNKIMLRYFSRAMTTITRSIHTPMHTRPVKAVNVRIDDSVPYPTLGDGLYYNKQIFDIQWTYENILKL